ncbi:MAG: hypothetical protein R3E77_11870 [Steroidobacteraceae bacterium]
MPSARFVKYVAIALATQLLVGAALAGPGYDFDRHELESILADLKAWLPGQWSSAPQVWYERNVRMPAEGEHEHWHRTFALIDAPQVGDVVFYGQINVGGSDGPLLPGSQILYKAWIDPQRSVVAINGQGPVDPQRYADLHAHPELWHEVRMRDPDGIHCDFIWRRDGDQIVGVLDGKSDEYRKYGPGTCSYVSKRTNAEFMADAEWVLTPETLWLYDLNMMGGRRMLGRKDHTHIRLYRAHPFRCHVRDATGRHEFAAHDRGYTMPTSSTAADTYRLTLLRAFFPGDDDHGLRDELRLQLAGKDAGAPQITLASAAPAAGRIRARHENLSVDCRQLQSGKP